MKIGQLVKRSTQAIFEYCETTDPLEFGRLQDPQYSKETFDINYPFCKPASKITPEEHVRFYNAIQDVHGIPVRVTSQWYNPPTSKSLPLLRQYMAKRKIAHNNSPQPEPTPVAAKERDRDNTIDNARNAFIRHLLSRIGNEQFNADQWKADQDYRAFLSQDTDRISAIEAHMAKHDYTPIGENQKLRQIIDLAHQDVRQLADRYLAIIDTMLAQERDNT